MIQINNHIKWVFLIFSLLMVASCSKEDTVEQSNTGSLRLEIPMLEDISRATTEDGSDLENAIYSLRVLILDENDETIHNEKYTDLASLASSITIDKLPIGFVQIYVIANEESLGKDYTDMDTWRESVVTEGNIKNSSFASKKV